MPHVFEENEIGYPHWKVLLTKFLLLYHPHIVYKKKDCKLQKA